MRPVTTSGPAARRRAVAGVGVAVAAALGMTACGEQPAGSVAAQAAGGSSAAGGTSAADEPGKDATRSSLVVRLAEGADKPRLRCPTDERSLMIADFAVRATGPATPEDAVGLSSLREGERMVVGPRGTTVWIVRTDGTAREEIDLMRAPAKGWLLHMREACA